MIQGRVSHNLEPAVPLTVLTPDGTAAVESVVDTGFTGMVALPLAAVSLFGLTRLRADEAELADGSLTPVQVYEARITWGGRTLPVEVHCLDGSPLLGLGLLRNHLLTIEVRPTGLVEITPLAEDSAEAQYGSS